MEQFIFLLKCKQCEREFQSINEAFSHVCEKTAVPAQQHLTQAKTPAAPTPEGEINRRECDVGGCHEEAVVMGGKGCFCLWHG
jgi:hypothetical protein